MFRSLRLVPFAAALTLGLAAVGCAADAEPIDDENLEEGVPVDSTEDALVGSTTAKLHQPKKDSEEFKAIMKAVREKVKAQDGGGSFTYDVGRVYRRRSANGWAYFEVQEKTLQGGEQIFGDASDAILLKLENRSSKLRWVVKEFTSLGDDFNHERAWEAENPKESWTAIPGGKETPR